MATGHLGRAPAHRTSLLSALVYRLGRRSREEKLISAAVWLNDRVCCWNRNGMPGWPDGVLGEPSLGVCQGPPRPSLGPSLCACDCKLLFVIILNIMNSFYNGINIQVLKLYIYI